MIIENLRYKVLSKGENTPEVFPNKGDIFVLHVQKKNEVEDTSAIEEAQMTAEYIENLGISAYVRGNVLLENEKHPGIARYEYNTSYPKDTLIGQLVLKRVSEEI